MHNRAGRGSFLDPRTFLLLLLFANAITFFLKSLWIEIGWIVFIGIVMLAAGRYQMAVQWILSFGMLLLLQYIVLPAAPEIISSIFALLVNYSIRMFPCLMTGAFMIREITLRRFVLAMRKLHISEKLIISLSVTIRYFPAIKEETRYIKDAMSLRKIKFSKKLEAMLVTLMMSATATAEELSAAAVTRGIENPIEKTSLLSLKLNSADYICCVTGCLFLAGTFLIK